MVWGFLAFFKAFLALANFFLALALAFLPLAFLTAFLAFLTLALAFLIAFLTFLVNLILLTLVNLNKTVFLANFLPLRVFKVTLKVLVLLRLDFLKVYFFLAGTILVASFPAAGLAGTLIVAVLNIPLYLLSPL